MNRWERSESPRGGAEFESDLIRLRTREGMAIARAQGKLKGRQPTLSEKQQRELRRMYETGDYAITALGELFPCLASPSTGRSSGRVRIEHPTRGHIESLVRRSPSGSCSGPSRNRRVAPATPPQSKSTRG